MKFTRLIKASGEDLLDTLENYMGFGTNGETDSSIDENGFLDSSTNTIELSEIDPIKLSSIIQATFFDTYGTNLQDNKEKEVIDNLPHVLENSEELIGFQILKVFKELKAYEWIKEEAEDPDFISPTELTEDVDTMVEYGDTDDIDDAELDDAPDEEEEEPVKDTPTARAKATKSVQRSLQNLHSEFTSNESVPDSWYMKAKTNPKQRYSELGLPIIDFGN